jgi:hypothetical protein
MFGRTPTDYREAFPPTRGQARVPMCVVRANTRPQVRTFREDDASPPRPDSTRSINRSDEQEEQP